jgi:hypothetical protein
MNPSTFYVDLRMQEWGMGEQSRRIRSSVRRVLNELTGEALLFLKDPRLEVKVLSDADLQRVQTVIRALVIRTLSSLPTPQQWQERVCRWLERHPGIVIGHSVWAYFPVHRRRYVARLFPPKPETRVLLVFSTAGAEKERRKVFEDQIRDHLGHVLLYLRSPKARNDCPDAMKEWRRSTRRAA